ncbi:MAG: cobalamin biosynthesis protein, partial [Opitutaceae bacterium]|nr:cobalamin biosynthesis protein [Opitutaceae bacterium]
MDRYCRPFCSLYLILSNLLFAINPWVKIVFDALIIFQCLAFKDLVKHVRAVKQALEQNIKKARQRVSWIVGRDTDRMDTSDVCRATIESGSENLNDAVIAPLFWLALFGPLGVLIFRITNTLDAMVGHRTERYEKL